MKLAGGKLRVGLANETDSPGGAETMVLQLARELSSRGHEVVALGTAGGEGWLGARFAEMGVNRVLVNVRGPFGLGTVPQIARVLRKERVDVLHSHDYGMAVCGALGARLAGCRHVITMHGGPYYSSNLRRRSSLRLAMALSHRTVVVSHALRATLTGVLGVGRESVDVIHNGVARLATVGPAAVRDELCLDGGDILVVAVGNLKPVKGHEVLLEAVARLPRTSSRVAVAIAGTGTEEAKLKSLAGRLGLGERLHLLGFRPDVHALLDAADIFAMPSVSEGLPMAMIEAMLSGRAIVASDVGGIPELVDSSAVGLLVPPGDAEALAGKLAELIRDAELRSRLGEAARARALMHFTASAMAERYLALYSSS